MKKTYSILFIIIVTICCVSFNRFNNRNKNTLTNDADRLCNEFFFPDNTNFIKYNVDYMTNNGLMTFQIIDEGFFLEGKLYLIQLSESKDDINDEDFFNRFDMTYFYVNKNEIYKINTIHNLSITK